MFNRKQFVSAALLLALMAPAFVTASRAAGAAREEGGCWWPRKFCRRFRPCRTSGFRIRCCRALTASP